jgi:hypothetical protein
MIIVAILVIIFFVTLKIGQHLHNDLIQYLADGYMLLVILIDFIFFKNESPLYQLFFTKTKPLYLKEIKKAL